MMTIKHISSRDNPLFKKLKNISSSARERRLAGQILLDGAHVIEAYADTFDLPELVVVNDGDCAVDVLNLLERMQDTTVVTMPQSMFAGLSPVATPTGMLALANKPALPLPQTISFALMLEAIQDPGNLGSMLRTAAAAGVDVVYLSEGCAEAWSPKALRGGQGAQFVLPIVEQADLLGLVKAFDGKSLATAMHGESLYAQDLKQQVAFVMGNEGAGVSDALLRACSKQVHIPNSGKVESLNAAAATAICLFERMRQTLNN